MRLLQGKGCSLGGTIYADQYESGTSLLYCIAGVANAIMVMPQFMNIVQRHSPEQRPEATEQATSPGTGAASAPTSKDLLNVGKGTDCSVWQLLTAHENGQCLLWDISDPMTFQPIAKFAVPGHPAR